MKENVIYNREYISKVYISGYDVSPLKRVFDMTGFIVHILYGCKIKILFMTPLLCIFRLWSKTGLDRFETDYSGVGNYGQPSSQRDYGNYDNSEYSLPRDSNYMHGNRKYDRYDRRNHASNADNYYGNKYDAGNYDNEPTNQFGRVLTNLLETSMEDDQKRVPVRDWSRGRYESDNIIDHRGYGHRGRRGVSMETDDVIKKGGKVKHKVIGSLRNDGSHLNTHHHNYIEQMSMKEIGVRLKNTVEKVKRIRQKERNRTLKMKQKQKTFGGGGGAGDGDSVRENTDRQETITISKSEIGI